jgi:tryptophan synthase alpha chain
MGFGVKTPERAAEIGRVADAVVVGSAIVAEIAKGGPVSDVIDFVGDLAAGAHRA